jgi:hypothetical protein
MTIASLKSSQKATATREVLASNDVRTLIANQLGVDLKRVTDEAHLTDDLEADWSAMGSSHGSKQRGGSVFPVHANTGDLPMMARSTRGSNQRPDTLMQDRTSANSMKVLLQRTAGPYIGS